MSFIHAVRLSKHQWNKKEGGSSAQLPRVSTQRDCRRPLQRRERQRDTVFSRLNALGIYLKLGLVDLGLFEPGVYLFSEFCTIFVSLFFSSAPAAGLLN